MFKDFETNRFPESLCAKRNAREPQVRDGHVSFLCVLVTERFPHECSLKTLTPYTCPDVDDPSTTLYGWADRWGNVYDHKGRSIHGDDERVVAWKKLDELPDFIRLLETEAR